MTPAEAEVLAARTLAAIDDREQDVPVPLVVAACAADRERVASDLAGLRRAIAEMENAVRLQRMTTALAFQAWRDDCAEGLRRTAALYGVTP